MDTWWCAAPVRLSFLHQLMLFWMSTIEDIEGIFTLIFFWQGENTSIFSLKMRCSVHAVQRG